MQRISRWAFVLLLMIFQAAPVSAGWLWGSSPVVTIDGQQFGKDAVRQWWNLWKESGWIFPDTAEPFVRWKILAAEGRNMGLDQTPQFARKAQVFLKVRAMMTLKREEVDRKMVITDKEIRQVYDRDYRPLYHLQLLYYDTRAKAEAAMKSLAPFRGRPAGKLVFADLQGVAKDKGGPLRYQETTVAPARIVSQDKIWKQEVDKLTPAGISGVIVNSKVFVLLRLDSISEPDPADFAKRKKSIRYKLWKLEQARLTNALVARLSKKYGLEIDKEVMAAITLGRKDYDKEFRDRTVARIKDFEIKAGKLIDSVNRERKFRSSKKYNPKEFEALKRLALNSMYTQTLIIWEAMNRHYEQREPLKSQFAFYRESILNKAVKARLARTVKLTDAEVEEYYRRHREEYAEPDMVVYSEVTADKELMDRAWAELQRGRDFFEVVRRNFHHDASTSKAKRSDIYGEKRDHIQKLAEGEVSRPFLYNGKYIMVKLISRREKRYIPFKAVERKIRKKLQKERFAVVFEDFLKRLRAGRKIRVNDKAWKQLQAGMGD